MQLIYCAGKNRRFEDIAHAAGFQIGAQVPCTVYHDLYFCDQNWKKPNRLAYMTALKKHRPCMATVLDWERDDQLSEVLDWAEEAALWCAHVLIVPKVIGEIDRLPRQVNNKPIILALSVPTRYGGTQIPIWEFTGWPVHLLGGSPQVQIQYYLHLSSIAHVISADGNTAQNMATSRAQFWVNGTATYARNRYWPQLSEVGWNGNDAPYEAFRRSCKNIMVAWQHVMQITDKL